MSIKRESTVLQVYKGSEYNVICSDMHFVLCPKQGMYFRNFLSWTGLGSQPSAAHLYLNIGWVTHPHPSPTETHYTMHLQPQGTHTICVCNPLLFYRKHSWLWVHYLLFLIVEGQWWNQCFEQLHRRSDFSPENHITSLSNFAGRNNKRGTQNPSKSLKKPPLRQKDDNR